MELYSLSVPISEMAASTKYLEYYESIKKFTFYFKSTAATLINEAERSPIKTDDSLKLTQAKETYSILDDFNKKIEINQLNLTLGDRVVSLTSKETEYLKAMASGLTTAKAIANNFGVSNRTAEHHLQNLKDKLGVYNKSDLLKKLGKYWLNYMLTK